MKEFVGLRAKTYSYFEDEKLIVTLLLLYKYS